MQSIFHSMKLKLALGFFSFLHLPCKTLTNFQSGDSLCLLFKGPQHPNLPDTHRTPPGQKGVPGTALKNQTGPPGLVMKNVWKLVLTQIISKDFLNKLILENSFQRDKAIRWRQNLRSNSAIQGNRTALEEEFEGQQAGFSCLVGAPSTNSAQCVNVGDKTRNVKGMDINYHAQRSQESRENTDKHIRSEPELRNSMRWGCPRCYEVWGRDTPPRPRRPGIPLQRKCHRTPKEGGRVRRECGGLGGGLRPIGQGG